MSEPVSLDIDAQALMALGVALDRLGVGSVRGLAEVALLVRGFPQWAVGRQASGRLWVAVRSAGSRPLGPETPTVWARAGSAAELADRMRAGDGGLSSDWGLQPGR